VRNRSLKHAQSWITVTTTSRRTIALLGFCAALVAGGCGDDTGQTDATADAGTLSQDVAKGDLGGVNADAADTADTTAPDVQPQCKTEADCPAPSDGCHKSVCMASGTCAFAPAADGKSCDDGNTCTAGESCQAGVCSGGKPSCGCKTSADCAKSEDGNACNGTLYCDHSGAEGVCKVNPSTIVTCAKLDEPCRANSCDPKTGACKITPTGDGKPCDDGVACTEKDVCKAGKCAAGTSVCDCKTHADCLAKDDGNLCNGTLYCDTSEFPYTCEVNEATTISCAATDDTACRVNTCDPKTGACGMVDLPPSTTCTDGDACSMDDRCKDGACASGKNVCPCKADKDCASLDPKNVCLGKMFCDLSAASPGCRINPASVVDCPDSGDNPCRANTCEPASGICKVVPLKEGKPCTDGNKCTEGDVCKAGSCAAGKFTCKCTTDAGCAAFEDGNACNGTLYCDKAKAPFRCRVNPSSIVACPQADDPVCSRRICQPKSGSCAVVAQNEGGKCDADGTACTPDDRCKAGTCTAGANICPCAKNGDCAKHDDGDKCNGTLFCSKLTVPSVCKVDPNSLVHCPKGDDTLCAASVCDPKSGACGQQPRNQGHLCNADNNVCTADDACDLGTCVTGTNACACTEDKDCATSEDGDVCNGTLYCDKTALPFACKVNPATVITCKKKGDAACSAASCDAKTGACSSTVAQDGAACDDGVKCTVGDTCKAGSCQPGAAVCGCATDSDCAKIDDADLCNAPLVCDKSGKSAVCKPDASKIVSCPAKKLACAEHRCDPKDGACKDIAVAAKQGGPCTDGNACTTGDRCKGVSCAPTGKLACDDNNPCTSDSCDALKGCQHAASKAPCEDGDKCTTGDTCGGGKCAPGTKRVCDDGNACTTDACAPFTGKCAAPFKPGSCDDNNACTLADACTLVTASQPAGPTSAECSGKARDCNDLNDCTSDFCQSGKGCVHNTVAGACEDGNKCTTGDFCVGKTCTKGKFLICDDGNLCTQDVCASKAGCVAKPHSQPCSDGNPCTKGDVCAKGVCKPGAFICACKVDQDCAKKDDGNPCNGTLMCNKQGSCAVKPGSVISCKPTGSPCTAANCNPKDGKCVVSAVNSGGGCNADNSACTAGDSCDSGTCKKGKALVCNDGNPCTFDTCSAATGCVFAPTTASCDDGDACTVNDSCAKGSCQPGKARACDDGKVCTTDACDKLKGCVTSANTAACNDNNACTTADSCKAGACVGGAAPNCDDNNPCTNDGCDKLKGCTKLANAASCEDGNKCTLGDNCKGGACVSGAKKVCDDNHACTNDVCQAKTGACQSVAISGSCSDGSLCTKGDACVAGVCKPGAKVDCDDANECTIDQCKALSGCHQAPAAGSCDDGNGCTVGEQCENRICKSGKPRVCNDNNVCTADSCDPEVKGGCVVKPIAGSCDDGNPCTQADACSVGACKPGNNVCGCTKTTDCAGKEDGNACNGTLVCDTGKIPYTCKVDPKTVVSCDKSGDTICKHNVCAEVTGKCAAAARNNGASCDADGDKCTGGDACATGTCTAGAKLDCNDKNPCTDDSCAKAKGCVNINNGKVCSDGNACTTKDVCINGSCIAVGKLDCDDKNVCTTDSCNTVSGCVNAANANPCDDNNPCTTTDRCAKKVCVGSGPRGCNDNNVCTTDTCSPKVSGGCVNTDNTVSCDDNSKCTKVDTCTSGSCVGTTPLTCNDNNDCTTDSCVAATGCKYVSNTSSCDDANQCTTVDTCSGGKCVGSTAPNCDDKNECTADSCASSKGCINTALNNTPCNDGDKCKDNDSCATGFCVGKTTVSCSDGNPCTNDTCDPSTGCSNENTTGPCDDNNKCTTTDMCTGGKCAGSGAQSCDDINACTTDTCDPAKGCQNVAAAGTCDDGDKCTTGDKCGSGFCVGGPAPNCDDGNVCTNDSCDMAIGCQNMQTPMPCDDGNKCTTADTCIGGVCKAGIATVCDDGNGCTLDSCDPKLGCQTKNNDGAACSIMGTCATGVCSGGACKVSSKSRLFAATSGGKGLEIAYDVVPLSDGTWATAGSTASTSGGDDDGNFVVWTSAGVVKVNKRFGTAVNKDFFRGLTVAKDGTLVLAGGTATKAVGQRDFWLVKVKIDGTQVWEVRRGTTKNDLLNDVMTAANGDIVTVGLSGNGSSQSAEMMRYTTAGKFLWSKTWFGTKKDVGQAVAETPKGELVMVGWTQSKTNSRDALLVKMSAAGKQVLAMTWGSTTLDERARDVTAESDGLVIAGGKHLTTTNRQLWITKRDTTSGKLLWEYTYGSGGTGFAFARAIVKLPTGYGLIGERRGSSGSTLAAMLMYRVTGDGRQLWSGSIGGTGVEAGYGAFGVSNGDIVASGTTSASGAGGGDAWLVRMNSWGHTTCTNAGMCGSFNAADCDDKDPCTLDDCTVSSGCVSKKVPDGYVCGVGKVCKAGLCL